MLEVAKKISSVLERHLEKWKEDYEIVGDVRGMGATRAIDLVQDKKTRKPAAEKISWFINMCFAKELILLSCGLHRNVIRFVMPLVITEQQLMEGLNIIEESFKEISFK